MLYFYHQKNTKVIIMNRYGLLGRKLGHSKSKEIHEYFFNVTGVEACYDMLEIEEDEIKAIDGEQKLRYMIVR